MHSCNAGTSRTFDFVYATVGPMGAYWRGFDCSTMLSDSETETETSPQEIQLTINEHYAKAYATKKEREEWDKRISSLTVSYTLLTSFLPYTSERNVWL